MKLCPDFDFDHDNNCNEKLAAVIDNIVNKREIYIGKRGIRENLDSLKSDD
jgi:hypothetical protein